MLLREYVQVCPVCEEATPHSRRVVVLPKLVMAASLVAAIACCFGGPAGWIGAAILAWLALLVFLAERERFRDVSCERCRGQKLRELRRTKPTLDGNTEIIIS